MVSAARLMPNGIASRELGSSCDSVNGEEEQEEDSEPEPEEDSWSAPDKPLLHVARRRARRAGASPILSRARELRTRFNGVHLRRKSARRRHVNLYPSRHNMRNRDMDSDQDDFYSSSRRRAALSLRPITQKSYKDVDSALNCNSDDSTEMRRVTRRSRRNHYMNQSWIGDDQMHKVGYPTLNQYSDEDSRDAEICPPRKKGKYHFFSGKAEKPPRETASQDKENKEDAANRANAASARPRRAKNVKGIIDHSENEAEAENADATAETADKTSEIKEEDVEEEQGQEDEEVEQDDSKSDDKNAKLSSSESEEEEVRIGPRLRTRNRKRKMSSSSSEGVRKSYSLRERRAKPEMPLHLEHLPPARNRNLPRFHGRRFSRRTVSSSSDSSNDSDRRHNAKYSKPPKSPHSKNEQLRTGAGMVQPIAPETLDPKINFASVGGLKDHVQCLKEMVLLPMMYPEVFARFQIQPSRGVLFHGPPGTGKTLLARALANECSFGTKKVSFFMRKGADLLSKWIGESEKQLRMLFEQAAEKRPSIIFFDELDGLAPVRSGRQDQVHASIVSTLLALMDGLTNRGEIIVIGATNRIDAIDPALRRPGRFDRELFFPLPAQKEREEILKVHLTQWTNPPNDSLITYLAENSVGYCGSDLKALCSEAVIQSFRRTYPQVYTSDARLALDPDLVKVEKVDFLRAKSVLVPASHRVTESVGNKLNSVVHPLLQTPLAEIMTLLQATFPHGANPNLAKVKVSANVRAAQMLVSANGAEYGNSTYLAPALLHHMEHIHSYVLDLAALHREGGRTPEEACIQIFHEAKRNVPSIIYIPNIDTLWQLVSDTVIGIFETQLKQIGANNPILLLATADTAYHHLPDKLQGIFSTYRNEVYEMPLPDRQSRYAFFKPLILEATRRPPRTDRPSTQEYPELPRAPTPEPAPVSQEAAKKMYEAEEGTLRELRIFLRDICKKLASNRLFFLFTKPVDTEEVPDYPTIIKEPMDLETMMTKVDFHRYQCAKDFLDDIDLICRNALEYNPARTSADKQIRHRACSLRDYAYALIKAEMDSDFEDKCKDIACRRQQRNASVAQYLPDYLNTPEDNPNVSTPTAENHADGGKADEKEPAVVTNGIHHTPGGAKASSTRRRKLPSWQRGCVRKRKRTHNKSGAQTDACPNEENASGDEDNGKELNESQEHDEKEDSLPKEDSLSNAKEPEPEEVQKEEQPNATVADSTADIKKEVKTNCDIDLMSPSELLEDPLDFDDIDKVLNESSNEVEVKVDINEKELQNALVVATAITKHKPLSSLLDLHFQLSRIVKKYIKTDERASLPSELLKELQRFKESHADDVASHSTEMSRPGSSMSALSQLSDRCIADLTTK